MLPRSLDQTNPESERRLYKVVCLFDFRELPGLILAANVDSGRALMRLDNGASQEFLLGPGAISIVVVGR